MLRGHALSLVATREIHPELYKAGKVHFSWVLSLSVEKITAVPTERLVSGGTRKMRQRGSRMPRTVRYRVFDGGSEKVLGHWGGAGGGLHTILETGPAPKTKRTGRGMEGLRGKGCKRTVAYFSKRAAAGVFFCCVGVGTALLCAEGEVLTSMTGSGTGEDVCQARHPTSHHLSATMLLGSTMQRPSRH